MSWQWTERQMKNDRWLATALAAMFMATGCSAGTEVTESGDLQTKPASVPVETTKASTEAAAAPTASPTPAPPAEVWRGRVFYEIFVRSFYDSSGDGIGDLQGVIEKLDYLNDGDPTTTTDLGVTGLWLMPIMEAASYHGYDVTDYRTVESDYGTNEDFRQLVEAAHERGMLVIVDMVMNHTSREHPWFLDASAQGEYNDYYIWREDEPAYTGPWGQDVWHPAGDRFYFGLFWEGMPDLNLNNPDVTAELHDIARFWVEDMGADGFRLDAAKHLIEHDQIQENTEETRTWLSDFRRYVRSVDPDVLVIGEVWSPTLLVSQYIPESLDLAFEFDLSGAMIQSADTGSRYAVAGTLRDVRSRYPADQFAAFLTNHDMNRAMDQLDGDVGKMKVAAALLLTGPGVPFLYYGEEIGMVGSKPDERIRTPMQWTAVPVNAGFSAAQPWEPLQEANETSNVEAQAADPASLLSHYRALIHLRNTHPALSVGDFTFVESDAAEIYAFIRISGDEIVMVLINLDDEEVADFHLSLEDGPLSGTLRASVIYGDGEVGAPSIDASGGFDNYQPVPAMAPHSTLIIQLAP